MPNTPVTPDTSDASSTGTSDTSTGTSGTSVAPETSATPNTSDTAANCDYEFTDDNLLALWLEFQKEQAATCPVTDAKIDLSLENDPAEGGGEPVVQVKCTKCGREAQFKPGPHEGFGWAE